MSSYEGIANITITVTIYKSIKGETELSSLDRTSSSRQRNSDLKSHVHDVHKNILI